MQQDTVPPVQPAQIFVGFCLLEDWAETIDPNRPILAMPMSEPGPTISGLQVDELIVVCQQVSPEGHILYCRLRAASLTRCYGIPFDPDWHDRKEALESLWEAVSDYLQERGLAFQKATVAPTSARTFLEGRAQCIRFDAAAKRYRRSKPLQLPPVTDLVERTSP